MSLDVSGKLGEAHTSLNDRKLKDPAMIIITTAEARATLEAARQNVHATKKEINRIFRRPKCAMPSLDAIQAAMDAAKINFEDVVASNALGEVSKDAVAVARTELKQREKDHRTAKRAAANLVVLEKGMSRRLTSVCKAHGKARGEVTRAENMLILAELAEADRNYIKAAFELARYANRVRACADLLSKRDSSLVPVAASNCLNLPNLPAIGPHSDETVVQRSLVPEQSGSGFLVEALCLGADPLDLEAQMLGWPVKARRNT
jgi:hypothetical protein